MTNSKIYLIAGEPSGDLIASRLMKAISRQKREAGFVGVGGESMTALGFKSLFDVSDLAIMGIMEVVPKIPLVLRRINETVADIKRQNPAVVVTVDSFSFAARVLKKLKKQGIKIPLIHYVAPQVWAWKPGRAKTMGAYVDHLLCLLGFEPELFRKHGLKADFVGHPVIEGGSGHGDRERFLKNHDLSENDLILTMLPGSRKNEVAYLLGAFKKTAELLATKYENLKIVIPTVKTVKEMVEAQVKDWPTQPLVVVGEDSRYDAFAASTAAIAASGTVALELAQAGVANAIAYRFNWLSAFLARRLIKVKYANLINILADKMIIPELIQEDATPEKMAAAADALLGNETFRTIQNIESAKIMRTSLKNGGRLPSDLAAEKVLAYL